MDEKQKQQLVAQFAEFLDSSTECASEPGGEVDLFTLFTELAALRSEVRLESRQFRTALDDFRKAFDTIAVSTEDIGAGIRRLEASDNSRDNGEFRTLLAGILDIHDRVADAASAMGGNPGFFSFLCGAMTRRHRAHVQGIKMLERRILEFLASCDVRRIESVDMKFDPDVMKAVGFEVSESHEDGTVCRERRAGFMWRGRVLRPAEVIVARKDGTDE